jgi:hypothetical protein
MATRKVAKKTGARGTAAKKTVKRAGGKTAAKSMKKTAAQKPVARKAVKKTAAKKPAARKAVTKQTLARKAAAKKPVARKVAKTAKTPSATKKTASATKQTGRTATRARPSTPKGPAPQRSARKTTRGSNGISREQALANTRELLAAKQQRDQESPPWQTFEQGDGGAPHPGYQSDDARVKADQLHEGEMRLQGNQGSISSAGRRRQGKRDSRPGT